MTAPLPPLPPAEKPRRRLLPALARWLVRLTAVLLLAATCYAFCDSLHWSARLASPFRPQLMVLGGAALLAAWWSRCGVFTRGVCIAAAVINLVVLAPWVIPRASPEPAESFHLVAWNAWRGHASPEEVVRTIEQSGADVVLLCELPHALNRQALARADGYQVQTIGEFAVAVRRDGPLTLLRARIPHPPNCMEAKVAIAGRQVRLLCCHSARPTTHLGARHQDIKLDAIRRWFSSGEAPTVVVGDYNQTPWCPPFRRMAADLELQDTSVGRGLTYTYPALPWGAGRLIGVPIDQCLITRDLACGSRWVGGAHGSNHRAVHALIGFRPE